jgi:periplasmic protein TonB
MTTVRLPPAFATGLIINAAMFWLLWSFISGPISVVPPVKVPEIDFTPLVPRAVEPPVRTRKAVPPEQQAVPVPGPGATTPVTPVDPPEIVDWLGTGEGATVHFEPKGVVPGGDGGGATAEVPLYRPQPRYPAQALRTGTEGWVLVQFTITASGSVADARVVDAEPHGVFDDAALNAIGRWKYNPGVEDGIALERRGVQVLLRFDVEN